MHANLEAARVHSEPPQKLQVFRSRDCGHPEFIDCACAVPWYVVDKPAGVVLAKTNDWPLALEFAANHLRAALTPEVCS